MNARTVLVLTSLVLLGALPGVALAGVLGTGYAVVTASAVATVAIALGWFGAGRWRRRTVLVALGAGTGVVAVAVAALAPQRGERRGTFDALADALANGWSTLLTSPLPADPSPRTLMPLALAVWATGGSAAVLARTGVARPARALVPSLAAIVGASVVAGREQHHPVVLGGVAAFASAVYLSASRPQPPAGARLAVRRHRRAGLAPAVAGVAVVVGAGLVIGPGLTFGREHTPFDPRDRIDPPIVPSGAVSPLELFASRQLAPGEPMFVVEADQPLLTRLVTLDRFDGARWTSSAAYRPSGTVVVPPDRAGVATRSVTASIVVDGLAGPWLPVVGDPTRITGVTFRVDLDGGTAIATSGDVLGSAYGVEAAVPSLDVAVLQALPTASDPEANAARELPPGAPALLDEMAAVATRGATTPLLNAALLQDYLQRTFRYDDDHTAGHSYGHLVRALTEAGEATEEQFASAFAVLGRMVGLPTRVVVGFGPGELQADGTYRVRAGDARVWPEVKFAEVGWVPFDPSPARDDRVGAEVPIGPGGGDGFVIQEADAVVPAGEVPPGPTPPADADGSDAWWPVAAAIAAAVLLACAVAGIATAVIKRSRTARRRTAEDATDRVVGAWADVLDRLIEIDGAAPQTRTVDEVIDASAATTSALAGLYRPVLRALYDDSACTEAEADQAWRARDRFVRACRQGAGRTRRIGWSIDPRPLRHRRDPIGYRGPLPRQEAEMTRSSMTRRLR